MKKGLIFLVVGLLLIGAAGTALAATVEQTPATNPSDQELYQQMYEACHGPNGYMTKYFGNGNVQQSYGGMMGGYGGMMWGYGSNNQNGI